MSEIPQDASSLTADVSVYAVALLRSIGRANSAIAERDNEGLRDVLAPFAEVMVSEPVVSAFAISSWRAPRDRARHLARLPRFGSSFLVVAPTGEINELLAKIIYCCAPVAALDVKVKIPYVLEPGQSPKIAGVATMRQWQRGR